MSWASIEGAHLLATFMCLATYGVYVYLAGHVIRYAVQGRVHSRLIIGVLTMVWICTTAAIGTRLFTTYVAFVLKGGSVGAGTFYRKEYRREGYSAVFQLAAYLNGIIADCLMCWRTYVVWNRSKVVLIIPLSLLLSLTASMSVAFAFELKIGTSLGIYTNAHRYWHIASISQTLTVNLLLTTLICWRIWHMGNSNSCHTSRTSRLYWHIIRIMIESGILYTATLILLCILTASKLEPAGTIFSYVLPTVTGITVKLVILRLFSYPEKSEPTTNRVGQSVSDDPSSVCTITQRQLHPPNIVHLEDPGRSKAEVDNQTMKCALKSSRRIAEELD